MSAQQKNLSLAQKQSLSQTQRNLMLRLMRLGLTAAPHKWAAGSVSAPARAEL
jgi:hypothetical protein